MLLSVNFMKVTSISISWEKWMKNSYITEEYTAWIPKHNSSVSSPLMQNILYVYDCPHSEYLSLHYKTFVDHPLRRLHFSEVRKVYTVNINLKPKTEEGEFSNTIFLWREWGGERGLPSLNVQKLMTSYLQNILYSPIC